MSCRTLVFSLGRRYKVATCVRALYGAPKYANCIEGLRKDTFPDRYGALLTCRPNLKVSKRFKYNKKSKKEQDEDDEDDEEEFDNDIPEDKNTKVLGIKVNSLRTDLVLKAGLNMARNKVEEAFYDSRVRVNGKKIFKKSLQLKIGDEVDIIRGPSTDNPNFIVVSRIEILSASEFNEGLKMRFRRNKTLLIENYDEPWKPTGD